MVEIPPGPPTEAMKGAGLEVWLRCTNPPHHRKGSGDLQRYGQSLLGRETQETLGGRRKAALVVSSSPIQP